MCFPSQDNCKPPLWNANFRKTFVKILVEDRLYSSIKQNLQWTLFGLANAFVFSHKMSNFTVDCGDLVLNSTASHVNVSPNNWAFAVISCPSMVNLQMNLFWSRKCPVTWILALIDLLVPDGTRISFSFPTAVNFGQYSAPDRALVFVFWIISNEKNETIWL